MMRMTTRITTTVPSPMYISEPPNEQDVLVMQDEDRDDARRYNS
jgi:hypothetical protein